MKEVVITLYTFIIFFIQKNYRKSLDLSFNQNVI